MLNVTLTVCKEVFVIITLHNVNVKKVILDLIVKMLNVQMIVVIMEYANKMVNANVLMVSQV